MISEKLMIEKVNRLVTELGESRKELYEYYMGKKVSVRGMD